MQKMILPGGWDVNNTPPTPNRKVKRMKKHYLLLIISSIVLLCVALFAVSSFALLKFNATLASNSIYRTNQSYQNQSMAMGNQPVTTINGLNRISVVGSTAFIVDGHGKTISVDPNPYGVAIAPISVSASTTPGSLKAGDIIVTNFGANETGTTLVRFRGGKGPGLVFNTMPNPGTKGPAFEAFNPLTGSDWVANFSANNVQVFRPNGTVLATITNPLFNKPWAVASNNGIHNTMDGSVISFFTTNTANATIDRIDVIPSKNGTSFRVFQIGQLTQINGGTKINLVWVPSLHIGGRHFSDVLLALDLANNRVAAYPNSTTLNTTTMRSTAKGMTVFQGKPLNMPGGLTINPLNGDLLVVNMNDNNLIELNLSQGKVVAVRQLENVPVDAQSGNGSALFGVAATRDSRGNLEVFFTDDNLNTLNLLSI
ncbi:MAG: hypothetical protein ACXVBU_02515 [Ktedonobacteraceae bacterium]